MNLRSVRFTWLNPSPRFIFIPILPNLNPHIPKHDWAPLCITDPRSSLGDAGLSPFYLTIRNFCPTPSDHGQILGVKHQSKIWLNVKTVLLYSQILGPPSIVPDHLSKYLNSESIIRCWMDLCSPLWNLNIQSTTNNYYYKGPTSAESMFWEICGNVTIAFISMCLNYGKFSNLAICY